MRLFNGLTIIIILLLVTSTSILADDSIAIGCSDTNPMCFEGELVYKAHTKYDTPFDPHEILNSWEVVAQTTLPKINMPLVVMGNPKINWKNTPEDLDPGLAIRPEGEDYSAVFFTFGRLPDKNGELENGTNELLLISYRDPVYGTPIIHKLAEGRIKYVKIVEDTDKILHKRRKNPMTVNYYIIKSFN